MKILAVDTSSKVCSVCLSNDKNIIIEKNNNNEKTHSQKLMPLIDEILKETNTNLSDIDLFACSIGPGSFTGLRIGISTIKAFCDVTNKKVIGISSLESLAYNVTNSGLIASIIDAKNDNVYFSLFNLENGVYILKEKFIADNINNILTILKKYNNSNITFVGDGAIVHQELLKRNFSNIYFSANNEQTSRSIAFSAFDKFQKGITQSSSSLMPLYLRKSQAERALDGEK